MPDSEVWEAQVENRVDALMRAVREMDQWLELRSVEPETRYFAQLALEELGTNVIKYGYDDQDAHRIQLRVRSGEENLGVEVEDDGHEFDPWARAEPDPNLSLDERTPGGWGISLVKRMAARADYQRRNGRNFVSLIFARPLPSRL